MTKNDHPHFSEPGPSRWPQLLAFALVGLIAAAIGVFVALGESPLNLFDNGNGEPIETAVAVAMVTPATAATEVAPPTATIAPELPTATAISQPPAAEPTAEPTATTAATPPPAAGPLDIVNLYADLWSASNYAGMYQLLSADAKAAINQEDFVARYTGIAEEAGLVSVDVAVSGAIDLETRAPITVTMETGRVGQIKQENMVQLRQEDGAWTIAWTPSLVIAGLGDDCIDFTSEDVHRGSIMDRDGQVLAEDAFINEVGIIPGQLQNETETLKTLSKLIGMSSSDIKAKYAESEPEWFVPVKELPDPLDPEILNGISQMKGVALREKLTRVYPYGSVAAHVTGYVSVVTADDLAQDPEAGYVPGEMIGRAGVEAGANDLLSGQPGGRLSIVDCSSRAELNVIGRQEVVPPQDLVLTIDVDFQKDVDRILGDVKGSTVVIDPRSGAILAMVSHPSFDPNLFVTGLSDKEAQTVFDEATRPLINRAAQQGYPTGSIFKVITMSAGMEDLGYEGGSEFYCPMSWSIPGSDQVWHDWTYENGLGDQGAMNLHNALVNSCNTIFYQIGYELDQAGENLLPDMAKAFGLGAPLGVEYLPEFAGVVPDPAWKLENVGDYWATGDAVNLSIGQGYFLATPLQMANAYAAIANGGELLQPFIVEYSRLPDGTDTRIGKRTVIHELPISSDHVAEIQSALRDQTSNSWGAGSATVFADYPWPIAGKTGTAQNQVDSGEKPHAWFVAFGPYGEEATITSVVMVENSGEGVTFAAPRTREIFDAYLGTDLAEESAPGS